MKRKLKHSLIAAVAVMGAAVIYFESNVIIVGSSLKNNKRPPQWIKTYGAPLNWMLDRCGILDSFLSWQLCQLYGVHDLFVTCKKHGSPEERALKLKSGQDDKQ